MLESLPETRGFFGRFGADRLHSCVVERWEGGLGQGAAEPIGDERTPRFQPPGGALGILAVLAGEVEERLLLGGHVRRIAVGAERHARARTERICVAHTIA